MNRGADKVGDVIDLLHLHTRREIAAKLLDHLLHPLGDIQGIAAAELVDRQGHRGHSLHIGGAHVVGFATKADSTHILKAHQGAIAGIFKHQIFKFFTGGQSPLQLNCEGIALTGRSRGTTDATGGHQTILAI